MPAPKMSGGGMKPVGGKRTVNVWARTAGLMERRAPLSPYVSLLTGLQGSWTIFSGSTAQWGKRPCPEVELLGFESQLCLLLHKPVQVI